MVVAADHSLGRSIVDKLMVDSTRSDDAGFGQLLRDAVHDNVNLAGLENTNAVGCVGVLEPLTWLEDYLCHVSTLPFGMRRDPPTSQSLGLSPGRVYEMQNTVLIVQPRRGSRYRISSLLP
jgi:hypothetical protein